MKRIDFLFLAKYVGGKRIPKIPLEDRFNRSENKVIYSGATRNPRATCASSNFLHTAKHGEELSPYWEERTPSQQTEKQRQADEIRRGVWYAAKKRVYVEKFVSPRGNDQSAS